MDSSLIESLYQIKNDGEQELISTHHIDFKYKK